MTGFENDIQQCLAVLRRGGLILYPTDTIWGIGCDATNQKAVEKIYRLKRRSDEKSMIILVSDEKEVLRYVTDPDPGIFDYLRKITKPTTVIYQVAKNLAENLIGRDNSIAIRICRDEFCKQLIHNFGKPIVSTSANISGSSSAKTFSEINDEIKKEVDYIVRYRQTDIQKATPSTVIKWGNGQAIIVRP